MREYMRKYRRVREEEIRSVARIHPRWVIDE